MKIKEYLEETTVSGSVDTYDVPCADKKVHTTDIHPKKRTLKNLPKGVKIED
jgi:hypothetical protein